MWIVQHTCRAFLVIFVVAALFETTRLFRIHLCQAVKDEVNE
jgi:hypothetical protein